MARQRVMSEQQYLNSKGVGSVVSDYMMDKTVVRKSAYHQRQDERSRKALKQNQDQYYSKRNQARREYQRLVSSGKVRAPTQAEQTWNAAHGLSENRSVQAARRVLAKHGVDWQTGKRITPAEGRRLWPTFTHKAKTGKSGGDGVWLDIPVTVNFGTILQMV
ncbi:hypothetical protein [Limosilactobacillus agrestis]|uniref:hypothetical protein n=1 Tax=Limosilactobacillus agrestis TaxID=2759748 RepID=UPI001E34122F|nr:hypothetical protein [Limosilactobacillus agrestis]MCD7113442.1 hypothetical protein [Limosilactobacillus agrestis]